MRVTKLIKDHVTKIVETAIPAEDLCPEYVRMKKICESGQEDLERMIYSYGEELAKEYREYNNIPKDWNFHFARRTVIDYDSWGCSLRKENDKLVREAEARRRAAIESVLLDMELGEVNKKNLAEAIAKALEE